MRSVLGLVNLVFEPRQYQWYQKFSRGPLRLLFDHNSWELDPGSLFIRKLPPPLNSLSAYPLVTSDSLGVLRPRTTKTVITHWRT